MAMNRFTIANIALGFLLGIGCRSLPRDQCGRFFPGPSAYTHDARWITNVEPNSFSGIALDSVSKNRLVGVSFYFQDLRLSAFTDSLGVARFRGLPEGWHPIVVRRIGYEQRRDTIQISSLSGTVAVYELPRRKVETCAVVITS